MPSYLPFPDIGPDIVSVTVFGMDLALRWYAMAYIVGLVLGMLLVRRLMSRPALWPADTAPMPAREADDLLTYMIIGVILGGRLGFVLFYQAGYYLANPSQILALWQGGMAFHGGFLGVCLGVFLFCRWRGYRLWSVADAVACAAPIGILLGRLANFINGELWGKPTKAPIGMVFPDERAQICPPGWQGPCGRHPSQLYEAALEGVLLFVVMMLLVRAGWLKRPGRMVGVFLIGYGLSRMIVEIFRQPDAQFVTANNPFGWVVQAGGMGLSQGQLLSLPMVLVGIAALVLTARARAK